MEMIDAVLVSTVKNLSERLDHAATVAEIADLTRHQPHIFAVFQDYLTDHREEVISLATRLLSIVWRMFESASNGPLERVEKEVAEDVFDRTTDLLFNLDDADQRFVDRLVNPAYSRQPYVMFFVLERCTDRNVMRYDCPLSDVELGLLFALLKSAVDAMHGAGSSSSAVYIA